MYWIFRIGFVLHVLFFIVHLFPVNHKYGYGGWIQHKDSHWQLTTYGRIGLVGSSETAPNILEKDTVGKKTKVLLYHSAIAGFYYSDMKKAFNDKALLVIVLEVLYDLLWLLLTYRLMKIFSNLKKNLFFEISVITHLRIIAMFIAFAPLIKSLHNYLFNKVMDLNIEIQGNYIFYEYTTEILKQAFLGFIPAILLIIVAEIFKHGFTLKQENDLTI